MSERRIWQVERDRFGVMYSGPLEVGEMIEVVPVSAERDRLFAAFLAGFETSGEGFNGEWRRESLCGSYYDSEGGKRFIDYMTPKFEKWLKEESK